jgi:hypothetical protein
MAVNIVVGTVDREQQITGHRTVHVPLGINSPVVAITRKPLLN